MQKLGYSIYGFIGFLAVTGFNVSLAVVFYSILENEGKIIIALVLLALIVFNALLCSIFDYIRRKMMIVKPVREILYATKQMTKGNFEILLVPSHSYQNYDEYDFIKDDLNKLAKELSKNEVLKNDFIANVSHEIKTPLAIIQNYAKMLENKSLSEEERSKYLSSLQENIKKISTLVSNILKLNKLENQQLHPEITEFNLSELLINQIVLLEDLIDKKEINLECKIEENLYINSEPTYLEIVFNNLLTNAIKFTSNKGNIFISLVKINDEYVIKFKDDGCGMDSETGKRIFDKFYQGDSSHSKEGNGLGLTMVKKVIDILGGTIQVDSEKNVGTTFTITIKEG